MRRMSNLEIKDTALQGANRELQPGRKRLSEVIPLNKPGYVDQDGVTKHNQ